MSGAQRSRSMDVGPPWIRKRVGQGASPAGTIRQPITVWPCGLRNDHGMKGRPGGASPPVRTGSPPAAPGGGPGGALAGLEPVPDRAVGPDPGAGHRAGPGLELGDRVGREVVAVEVVASVAQLDEEDGRAVRPPVGDLGEAVPGQCQVMELAGSWAPDRRRPLAPSLVADRQAVVTGDRRPGKGEDLPVGIVELADDLAGPGVEDPERGMDEIAVLTVLDRDERLVGAEAGQLVATTGHRVAAAEDDRFLRVGDPSCAPVRVDGVEPEAFLVGDRGDGARPARREALVPAPGQALREWLGVATAERGGPA